MDSHFQNTNKTTIIYFSFFPPLPTLFFCSILRNMEQLHLILLFLSGHEQIVQLLLEKGKSNVNSQRKVPFFFFLFFFLFFKFFLIKKDGITSFWNAEEGHEVIVQILIGKRKINQMLIFPLRFFLILFFFNFIYFFIFFFESFSIFFLI